MTNKADKPGTITVTLPAEPPRLTPDAARALRSTARRQAAATAWWSVKFC